MSALEGKLVLVTGASRGIGHGISLELARQGATVAGTATSAEAAARLEAELQALCGRGLGLVVNVNDAAACTGLVESLQAKAGRIYGLVNNAGVTRDNLLLRMKDAEWDEIMQTNLRPVFVLARAVLRDMVKAREGRIVNITSVSGQMGNAGQSNYAAAKAGVEGFTRSLAREVGSRGVTVNCVAPGFIDTDMTRALPEAVREGLLSHVPLGRLGKVQEVAACVAFLLGTGAAYVTGSTLDVNGGLHMR